MTLSNEAEFRAEGGGDSQNAKLRAYFLAHPSEWVSMVVLADQIGGYAVHSRIADLRRRWSMIIINTTKFDTNTRKRHSFYRYEPSHLQN